jgi:hypothetical protein
MVKKKALSKGDFIEKILGLSNPFIWHSDKHLGCPYEVKINTGGDKELFKIVDTRKKRCVFKFEADYLEPIAVRLWKMRHSMKIAYKTLEKLLDIEEKKQPGKLFRREASKNGGR